jgi:hypothetical protein
MNLKIRKDRMSKRLISKATCVFALATCLFFVGNAFAQSTGSIQGSVLDATGAPVPNATITIRNEGTDVERVTQSDSAGLYLAASLPVGKYRIEVKSPGMQTTAFTGVDVSVGSTVRQDISLKVAATSTTVEVNAAPPVVETSAVSVGAVVNQATVQEIPLNGRHFVDLALLIPGSVVPPANGFLTAPLRGQGSFAFNSAGAREDSVNYMVNGINLSDPNQNQITFQPTINTVEEAKIDNFTFSAEYGRNSGSIVNIATRSGVNAWHGEAYEFLRNSFFDARNFTNPTQVTVGGVAQPNLQNPFIRNQFGGDGGGAIKKDRTFAYLSYEGLRQRQLQALSSTTLTTAQRQQIQTTSDPMIQSLLPLIPLPNSGTNQFVGSQSVPVNIEQGTANFTQIFSDANRVNFYYAIQRDMRDEPPTTDGNSFPGGGDQRNGQRQLLTINETWAITPTFVNEARLGYNRILITFAPDNTLNAANFGIDTGVDAPIGLPQINVAGSTFVFGGINGFPQGRGDNVGVLSDTLSWVHGHHTIKFGAEFRRQNSDNFSYTPGTFSFPSVAAFIADQANSFTVTSSNRSNRTYGSALGAFVSDAWKIAPSLTVTLGVRYDWYGTPTEAEGRFVIFNPTADALQQVGSSGGPSNAYNQSALNFQPRVGIAWDPFKTGKTVIRSAYAIMTDQPTLGLVTGLAANPPFAFPVSYASTAAIPYVSLGNAFQEASGAVSPFSVAHNYHDAYVSEWNFNVQQQFGKDVAVMLGYFGSKGSDLNIERNYNQPIDGVLPFPTLSPNSPIDPGKKLSNILVYESDGNSSYNGLWLTASKRFSKGLQFSGSYTWSKSIDDNSKNVQGLVIQNSYDIAGDRGLSDFDARNRFVLNGVYDLPFKGNRFKDGWEISLIESLQSGNPLNLHITNSSLDGVANLVRPDVVSNPIVGYAPATTGSPTQVTYIQNPSAFVVQGTTPGTTLGFGNLGRNVLTGPGFADLDIALVKNTHITEHINWQIRADAFDLLNQTNFTNPVLTVGSSTFGLITGGTRVPTGDNGSARQLQLAMKLIF